MKKFTVACCVSAAVLGAGCASTTPTRETSSGYAIYDIKAGPEVGGPRIAEAIKVALQKNTSRVQINNGIPPSPLPDKAPRFALVSPLKGSNLGALAAASGQTLQVPTCDGATLTANARDGSMSSYGEGTSFFVCLMPYQGGYSLNIYTTFSKASGSFNAATLGATLARPLVGDSSQFIPRTIGQIVDGVQQAGASVALLEAYP
jgi:hypothetical protein